MFKGVSPIRLNSRLDTETDTSCPFFYMPHLLSNIASALGLSADINKVKDPTGEQKEGIRSTLVPELKLDTKDEDLIKRSRLWKETWNKYWSSELFKRQEANKNYWLGKQFSQLENTHGHIGHGGNHDFVRPLVDNLIYEALETFLPIVTRQAPEPFVQIDESEAGKNLAKTIRDMLIFQADRLRMRLKIKRATRFWALFFSGVHKIAWSMEDNDITDMVLKPQKLILDPTATIDEGGNYMGEYIGEHKEDTADNLIKKYPNKEKFISDTVNKKLGTKLGYIEWWTNDFMFWELNDEVLDKVRNPHWNYEDERETVDENGEAQTVREQKFNHFNHPKMPYVFLSVFNLQENPHDETTPVEQNLPLQDLLNKRYRQIEHNTDNLNGGWAISLQKAGLTKEQAAQVISSIRRGGGIAIPQGSVGEAIQHIVGTSLPSDVFNSLNDARNELRNIFGTSGSTPESTREDKTVRGKILTKTQDVDRSATIVDSIEQYSDQIFNWYVQMFAVYYTEDHIEAILGEERRTQQITLNANMFEQKITVSVKEGSLIPKDSLTKRNEAIDLWSAGAIDPKTLHDRLEDPDPAQTAENLFKWQTNPASLFPEAAQEIQQEAVQQPQPFTGTAVTPLTPQREPNLLNQVPLPR